jgi:hypothetical protein
MNGSSDERCLGPTKCGCETHALHHEPVEQGALFGDVLEQIVIGLGFLRLDLVAEGGLEALVGGELDEHGVQHGGADIDVGEEDFVHGVEELGHGALGRVAKKEGLIEVRMVVTSVLVISFASSTPRYMRCAGQSKLFYFRQIRRGPLTICFKVRFCRLPAWLAQ